MTEAGACSSPIARPISPTWRRFASILSIGILHSHGATEISLPHWLAANALKPWLSALVSATGGCRNCAGDTNEIGSCSRANPDRTPHTLRLDAQRFVADAAKENSLLVRARQHTEQVLGEFLRTEHWQLVVKCGEVNG